MIYPDLNALLADMPEADRYYKSLPDYVREQINTRPQGVNSLEDLQSYAEKLLRGDD